MSNLPKIVAIAWAPYQDHVEKYANQLGAQLYNVHYFSFQNPALAPIKYVPQTLRTWLILMHEHPTAVYILNPPVFAPLVVWAYCVFSGAKILMDTHYSALYGTKWKWLLPVTRFLAKRAIINIVDQERNKRLLNSWNAEAIVLEKPPYQEFDTARRDVTRDRFNIVVINTFAEDDPVEIILEAATLCADIDWYILGDPKRARQSLLTRVSKNVTFTGYLLKEDYWNCLFPANAVMALTTREYSLMAGAIDGLSIDKPLILSRQPALEEYFTKGVVFVDNEARSIARGVREFQKLEKQLIGEIASLHNEKRIKWEKSFAYLQNVVAQKS